MLLSIRAAVERTAWKVGTTVDSVLTESLSRVIAALSGRNNPVTLRSTGSSAFADDDTPEYVVRAWFAFTENPPSAKKGAGGHKAAPTLRCLLRGTLRPSA